MNHEEQAIQEAEDILKAALSDHKKQQIKEHQTAMPFLANSVQDLLPLDQLGTINEKVHIYAIRRVQGVAPDKDGLNNPLGIDTDDAVVARLEHMHHFESDEEVHECLNSMNSSIVLNEGSKIEHNQDLALFMSIRNEWFALYTARKLTISRRCGADFRTATASMEDIDSTPDKFWEQFPEATTDIKQHVTDLLFFAEAARLMEQKMPAVYKTMAKRLMDRLENDE